MTQTSPLSYDAGTLWQHCRPRFLQSIQDQAPEKVQLYLDECCRALLDQGTPWEIVSQVRNWMQLCAPTPLQPRKLLFPASQSQAGTEERKTPPSSPEPGARTATGQNLLSAIVRVEFTGADWERAKGKIISYNKQLAKLRQKNALVGKPAGPLQTPYIQYRELGPVEN